MLNITELEHNLLGLLEDMATRLDEPARARRDHARELASIIDEFVRGGQAVGTIVTTGTAATQTATVKLTIE